MLMIKEKKLMRIYLLSCFFYAESKDWQILFLYEQFTGLLYYSINFFFVCK